MIEECARRFLASRDAAVRGRLSRKIDNVLSAQVIAAAAGSREVTVTAARADEIAAALHARAPWMAAASSIVMSELRRRTADGPGGAGAPPMILTGPPGIGKSAWARHLAELLGVPAIQIDLGATQSGAFSLVGVERGWGTETPGSLVRTILAERIVNPVVIVDEIGHASTSIPTTRGSIAGMIPALMSLIEPTTARSWTCPFLQLDMDMSRVTWVMTTNAHDHLPRPLLDRCRVVPCRGPTASELREALFVAGADLDLWDDRDDELFRDLAPLMRDGVSLRAVSRVVEGAGAFARRPTLS